MERIIKTIEAKLAEQETTITIQKWEIEDLKKKLAEAEEVIKGQASYIKDMNDLKGESA